MNGEWLTPTDTLDELRQRQAVVRVVRDVYETNDIIGKIMGWNDDVLLIRKPSGTVLKTKREYLVQDAAEPRRQPL